MVKSNLRVVECVCCRLVLGTECSGADLVVADAAAHVGQQSNGQQCIPMYQCRVTWVGYRLQLHL